MDDQLKDKLLKLYELVKRGVAGEKDNAEFLMNRLLKKHDLTLDDINQNLPKKRYYKYTTLDSQTILAQVIFRVTDGRIVRELKKYKEVACEVNDFEHIQILEMFDFHSENYAKEKKQLIKDLTAAYVQKHKLFRTSKKEGDEERKPLTLEEKQALMRMSNLQDNLSNVSYTKKLE